MTDTEKVKLCDKMIHSVVEMSSDWDIEVKVLYECIECVLRFKGEEVSTDA